MQEEEIILEEQSIDDVVQECKLPVAYGLTEKEKRFCELYSVGKAPYAGNLAKCYEEAFGCDDPLSGLNAHFLMSKKEVKDYIAEISSIEFDRKKYIKEFVNANLMNIAEEMSYCGGPVDRNGKVIPPSSCRAVAVSALKLLMELNGLKTGSQDAELKIKNESGGNIMFNVIVPEPKKEIE